VIPLARRFSLAALSLFALAALPIWLHRTAGGTSDPCSNPAQLRHLAAFGNVHSARKIDEHEVSIHTLWVEGKLPPFAHGRPLGFRLVRGVDPSAFYGDLHAYFFASPLPEDSREVRALNAGSDVLPVHHQSDSSTTQLKLTQYFFALGLEPVTHPFSGGLSLALDQLVRGTQPITLFLISGTANAATRASFEERADAWLATAWSEYRGVCRS
jgi:hypothetical protein